MSRILSPNAVCIVNDATSGTKITLFYKRPSATQMVDYFSNLYYAGKINPLTRVKGAIDILIGIKEGDFLDEEGNPISSNPESEYYNEKWKEYLEEFASDILILFSFLVYEGSSAIVGEQGGSPQIPLSSNTNDG